jgi:ABC-2 type transport system permease protein
MAAVEAAASRPLTPVGRRPARRSARSVVARVVGRRAVRQGAIWGAVFGILVVTSAAGFVSTYPTAADRARIRTSLASNAGLQAVFGSTRHLDTVAGFTAWRALGLAALLGAVWGLLASTRLLRGEEEAGRWELLLAGQTTRGRATGQALLGLAAGLGAMLAVTAAITTAEGRTADAHFSVSASLFLSLALVAPAAVFLAVGAFTSQLAVTRRRAAILAAAAFGASFVIRMVANSSSGLHWLRWATPLGWVNELHALTGSRPLALLPFIALIVVLVAATLRLAARRDLGASTLPEHDEGPARTRLLGGPTGLAVRLTRPVALSWIAGIGALGLMLGLVAQSAAKSIAGNATIQRSIARLGGHHGGAEAYLGFAFVTVATLVALAAAAQASATRDEEAQGYLDNLLVRPVGRTRWLLGRLGVSAALVVAAALTAGCLGWVGAATQNTGVGLVRMLEAGATVVGPGLLVLGVGTLVHGIQPRLTAIVAYGLVAWSFLIELVGATISASHWLLDTSILYHAPPVPAADPNWTSAAAVTLVGVAAAALGALAFARRDLAGL